MRFLTVTFSDGIGAVTHNSARTTNTNESSEQPFAKLCTYATSSKFCNSFFLARHSNHVLPVACLYLPVIVVFQSDTNRSNVCNGCFCVGWVCTLLYFARVKKPKLICLSSWNPILGSVKSYYYICTTDCFYIALGVI